MNKKEALLRVSEQIRALAEDETTVSWDQWHEDGWINFRFKPHHEPPSDPYAELKAAHAAGKTIQFLSGGVAWRDCEGPPLYFSNLEYRIKPESQKLPLCADDVRAGAQFLSKCGQVWFPNHIREGYVCFGHFMSLTFQELIDDEWKIRCAGETEWRPCYKLVEQ